MSVFRRGRIILGIAAKSNNEDIYTHSCRYLEYADVNANINIDEVTFYEFCRMIQNAYISGEEHIASIFDLHLLSKLNYNAGRWFNDKLIKNNSNKAEIV